VKSPLTLKSNTKLLQTFRTADLRQYWQSLFRIDPKPYFRGVDQISKWKCQDSGLIFYSPAECSGPEDLYKKLRKHDWYYLREKWEYDEALKYVPQTGSVLEVGSGDGHFLRKAVRDGLSLKGLEMTLPESPTASNQSWSIIAESAQNHAQAHPGSYDVVCSFQVLEHVADPRGFLEASVELLSPNGRLIISTPNSKSFLRHSFNLLDMPPHHMSGWSEQTYRFLESIFPFKLERVMYEPLADYHVDYFMDTYSSCFAGRYDLRGAWARGGIGRLSRRLLNNGMRLMLRGQSMLAVFRKCP
jgi:SAM-dependent methyltransferase